MNTEESTVNSFTEYLQIYLFIFWAGEMFFQ